MRIHAQRAQAMRALARTGGARSGGRSASLQGLLQVSRLTRTDLVDLQKTAGNGATAALLAAQRSAGSGAGSGITVQRGTETGVLPPPQLDEAALVDAIIDKAGMDRVLVGEDHRAKLAQLGRRMQQEERAAQTLTGPKNKNKRSRARGVVDGLQQQIDAIITRIRAPLLEASAREEAKVKAEAADREAGRLEDERAALLQGLEACGLSSDADDLLRRAIGIIAPSSRYDEVIDRSYSVPAIVEACRAWRGLPRRAPRGFSFRILTELHSPSSGSDTIEWKERGPQLERTRNLILKVNGRTANIHVHPTGGHTKKR